MRVNVERLPGSTVELDIAADEEEFAVAIDKAFRKVARDITLPGFRRGKAPRNLIEKMVGRDAIVQEAGYDMMDELFRRAIEQEQLVPVGDPSAQVVQAEPLNFKVQVEVFPTVELGDYRSVRVESREVELEESEVDEVIDQLQRQHSEWVDPETERTPRDDDQITMDIQVYEGDEEFQEPAEDATFVLGETPLFESLVEAIKMMPVGTTAELTLAFDDDDETVAPELRGKELRYVVTLKGIKERRRPELDDEFAAKVGEQYTSFSNLKEQIEKDLLRNKAMSARGEVSTEIINAIADQAELEVPNSMVDREIEDELTQFRSRLAQQRLTLEEYLESNDQTEEDLREEIRPNAARRVRNSLVLQEVAKAENVSVTADDIAAEIERMITPMQNPERMREMYNSDYFRGLLENEMFDRKLTDTVIEIATEGRGAVTGAGAAALAEAFAPAAPAANTDAVAEGATESEASSKSDEGEALPTAQTETTDEPGEVDGSAMAAEAIEAAADSEDDADAASAAGTDDAGAETDAEGETETAAERE